MTDTDTPEQPDTEPQPDPEPQPDTEPGEPEASSRCEAETTVGGTLYRCALETEHEGEHAFQPAPDETGAGEAGAPAGKDGRKVQDALEKEAVRHAARLAEIFGATVPPAGNRADDPHRLSIIMAALSAEGVEPCPLCPPNFGGWRVDAAPTPEVTAALRVLIGLPSLDNFQQSTTERVCAACAGLGRVKTGSLDPRWETSSCDDCGGRGFVSTRQRQHPDVEEPAPVANGQLGPPQWDDDVIRDMFGTPITDEDYGKMPALRKRPIDYWTTHRH